MDDVRTSVRAWLRSTLPDGWPNGRSEAVTVGWQHRFFESGWATPTWPSEYGGLGLEPDEATIVNSELAEVDAPVPYNMVTIAMIGATVLQHGTDEQKQRWLPDLAARRATWCQLFSEPGAGSDLASLATRAAREGGTWIVNGQKVWSSFAAEAAFGLLLARTDPDAPKQLGITAFVLPMSSVGVDVRPLRQLTGDANFCEVFLDDVHIADEDRLGDVNSGWAVARTMLAAERGLLGGEGSSPVARVGGIDVEAVLTAGRGSSGAMRERLIAAWIRERTVSMLSQRLGGIAEAGPLVKIAQTQNNQSLQELAVDILGPVAIANDGYGLPAHVAYGFLRSRANSIGGGTSEVLRNIVGESMLGLPREPDPYRGQPWSAIPRS